MLNVSNHLCSNGTYVSFLSIPRIPIIDAFKLRFKICNGDFSVSLS